MRLQRLCSKVQKAIMTNYKDGRILASNWKFILKGRAIMSKRREEVFTVLNDR